MIRLSKICITIFYFSIPYTRADNERKESIERIPRPVIFDTDYGTFIDDVFALGLLINSEDLLDLKYVLTTSENPTLSAQCVARFLDLADRGNIPVGIGTNLPDPSLRGSVCAVPEILGFPLERKCNEGPKYDNVDENGVDAVSKIVIESDRNDWIYIVVGGQSSVKTLAQKYPRASKKISTLIMMGGNWCSGFQPFPGIDAPTDETNIGCDPAAANFIIDRNVSPFKNVYYVPLEVADEIAGKDYMKILEAAESSDNAGAVATIEFYRAWSTAARAEENLIIHHEAMTFDPEIESTPQFDACAIMLALQLADKGSNTTDDDEDRLSLFEFEAVRFSEVGDYDDDNVSLNLQQVAPSSAFSLVSESFTIEEYSLPKECPSLTTYTFHKNTTSEDEMPVTVALGFSSTEAKSSFYTEMAERISGTFNKGTIKEENNISCVKEEGKNKIETFSIYDLISSEI